MAYNSLYPVDFPSEEILRKGFETLSRTEGFEYLATQEEPLAREYAIKNGFDRLSPETVVALKNDAYNFVRLAVQAMEIEKELLTLLKNKAGAMLCPGKALREFTGKEPTTFPSSFQSLQTFLKMYNTDID